LPHPIKKNPPPLHKRGKRNAHTLNFDAFCAVFGRVSPALIAKSEGLERFPLLTINPSMQQHPLVLQGELP
jgi:hypothetical protein